MHNSGKQCHQQVTAEATAGGNVVRGGGGGTTRHLAVLDVMREWSESAELWSPSPGAAGCQTRRMGRR